MAVMTMMMVVVPVVMVTIVMVAVVMVSVVVMPAPMHQLYAGRVGLCGLESLRQSRGRGSLRSRSHRGSSQQHGCGR